jgi:hypothetical protein
VSDGVATPVTLGFVGRAGFFARLYLIKMAGRKALPAQTTSTKLQNIGKS